MKKLLLASAALMTVVGVGCAKEQPASTRTQISGAATDLEFRTKHRRAVEAAIWGMPAVNYELMLQAAADNSAKLNQVVYWSKPVNWKNQWILPDLEELK